LAQRAFACGEDVQPKERQTMKRLTAPLASSLGLLMVLELTLVAAVAQAQPIPVGLIANLTGTDVKSSVHMTRGVELAVDEINASGGVKGRPIRLITEDSQYRAPEAINAATKLYDVNKVEGVIMFGGSSLMIPVAELAQQKGKVLLNTSSSSPKLGDFPGTLFSVLPLDNIMGKELGEWVASRGIKTAAFVVPNNTFGMGLMESAATAFEAKGGKVVRKVAYTEGQPDYRADMQAVVQAQPGAVISAGYGDDSRAVFRAARQLGLEAPWYAAYPSIFSIDEPQWTNGRFFGIDNGGPSLPSAQAVKRAYMSKYNEEPLTHVFYGYDAAMVLARAMREGGVDAAAIKAALPKVVQQYDGATGRIQWDGRGQRINPPIEFLEYKDGKLVLLQTRN
jgi:branched-chain amino acid transport system substrate-binding protein